MRHARQHTDITATAVTRDRPVDKKNRQETTKQWAKKKRVSSPKRKEKMATALSKLSIKENNPNVEMDSEIMRLRDEIQQEKQMK